ncbi:MAG: polysaccharide deacetylase family protein [Bacteroidota bacterium]
MDVVKRQMLNTPLTVSTIDYWKAQWYNFKDAAVSFTFDDGYRSHFETLAPMLEQLGFRGTFYIITNWVGKGETPSWDTLTAIAARGHEIGSHTKNHTNLETLAFSMYNLLFVDSAIVEMDSSKEMINRNIFPEKCETMAFPFGATSYNAILLAKSFYISCRGSGYILQPSTPYNFYNVQCKGISPDTTLLQMNAWIDRLQYTKGWLIERIHGIDSNGWEPVPSSRYASHLGYVKLNEDHLWIDTYKNVIKYIRERNNAKLSLIDSTLYDYTLSLTDTLADDIYNVPITLKVRLKSGNMVNLVSITQAGKQIDFIEKYDNGKLYVTFNAVPDAGDIKFNIQNVISVFHDNVSSDLMLECYPNPVNSTSMVSYFLGRNSQVVLSVFNSEGSLMSTIVNEKVKAGVYSVELNADDFPNGVYFLCLQAEKKKEVTRIVVVK